MVGEWRSLIDDYTTLKGGDSRVIFIEAWTDIDNTVRFYANSEGHPRSHFPFNFFLIGDLDADSTPRDFKQAIEKWTDNMPAGATPNWVVSGTQDNATLLIIIFNPFFSQLGNHDVPRFGSRYGTERIDGLLALVLTLPGVAITYNGEEIGMLDYREISWENTLDPQACNTNDPGNYKFKSRDPQRTPFQWENTTYAGFKDLSGADPWLPVHPTYPTLNLALQQSANKSHYKFYQQLAMLRNNDTFVYGEFKSLAVNDDVFGYVRSLDGEETYAILINFSDVESTVDVNLLGVNFKDESKIVVAGSNSQYNAG